MMEQVTPNDDPIIIEIPRKWIGFAIQFALVYMFFQLLFYLGGA